MNTWVKVVRRIAYVRNPTVSGVGWWITYDEDSVNPFLVLHDTRQSRATVSLRSAALLWRKYYRTLVTPAFSLILVGTPVMGTSVFIGSDNGLLPSVNVDCIVKGHFVDGAGYTVNDGSGELAERLESMREVQE